MAIPSFMHGVLWVWISVLIAGCVSQNAGTPNSSGGQILKSSDLNPEVSPGEKAVLTLAGLKVPVSVKYALDGQDIAVKLIAHGEIFEKEAYVSSPEAFRLREAADAIYSPPLDLLRFPMHVGDKWSWSGRMITGGISRPTKATVTTSSNKIYIGSVGSDVVESSVELEIFAGAGHSPTKRKLGFWFAPKKGLLRREFGQESIREPVAP